MRILSVRPSVRLSVKRVNCDKTEEKYVKIFIPYERSLRKRMVGGGDLFYLKFWVNRPPVGAKSPILNRTSLKYGYPSF